MKKIKKITVNIWAILALISVIAPMLAFSSCSKENVEDQNYIEVHNNYTRFVVKGVMFKMIKVEDGTFMMGSTSGKNNEEPVHQVTLTNDFYIGETEVTQKLWKAVMGSNPSWIKDSMYPVTDVSWDDCQIFLTKLNKLTGRTFRLPTEAEWEYAARGGNASMGYTYSGSNTLGDVQANNNYQEVATKAPNELGIYDMSGSVWEWCQDWYGSYGSDEQINPTGPDSGTYRVARGGSTADIAFICRVTYRDYRKPTRAKTDLGLRLAL